MDKEIAAARELEVRSEMGELEHHVDNLEKALNSLQERLVFVSKVAPEEADGKSAEQPHRAPLAEEIHSLSTRVLQANKRVSQMERELEI